MPGIYTCLHPCRTLLLPFVWLLGNALLAQDLNGTWHGELVHDANTRFVIDMKLSTADGRITGTMRSSFPFQEEHFAVTAVEGECSNGRCRLRETGMVEQGGTGYRWVLQGGSLLLDTLGGEWRLLGEWRPPGCEAGQMVLFKKGRTSRTEPDAPPITTLPPPLPPERVEGRKVHWAGTMTVRDADIVLWLYDDLRYDGDTVSVYLNGQCVASRIEVPHRRKPRSLTVRLAPGTNYLVMHAENEGSEAPNTAGLVVRPRHGRRHQLIMRSTMNHSAGLVLECDP
ncbi:MAG: hypothetical protein H6591_08780 [Flavobacteriales bacterium]|nr:hypothetical protein [Flavobacteriales bacterium]